MAPIIRDLQPGDEAAWRLLWSSYCTEYGVAVPEAVTAALWPRLLDPAVPLHGLVAEGAGGTPAGIAHYVLHPYTWGTEPVCYLEDLFVGPSARRRGLGGALVAALLDRCREHGWARLYWMAQKDNPARALYDGFAPADDHVRYLLRVTGVAPPRPGG